MSDRFFTQLAARTLGILPRVEPVVAARFEPARDLAAAVEAEAEVEHAAPARTPAQPRAHARASTSDTNVHSHDDVRTTNVRDVESRLTGPISESRAPAAPAQRTTTGVRAETGERGSVAAEQRIPFEESPAGDASPAAFEPHGVEIVRWRTAPAAFAADEPAREVARVLPPDDRAAQRMRTATFAAPAGYRAQPSAPRASAALGEPSEPPAVVVRIGRIDVRAVQPPAPPPPQPKPRRSAPSLADHLRARDGGAR